MDRAAVERALGARVQEVRPVFGGNVNRAARLRLSDGRRVFVKHHERPPPGMFEAEASGLRWLAEPGAIRVAEVLAWGPDWLALTWVEAGRATAATWERLGRELAALHAAGAPAFGGPPGFIGTLPQAGGAEDDWARFYGEHRLRPQVRAMVDRGWGRRLRPRLDALIEALPERVGPPEPPARLHGDLWSGNLVVAADGSPVLVDPAACAGHREVDLAMMRLFGGFDARTFDAYAESRPLAPGAAERLPLYQLYFLLVHVNLHGPSWLPQVDDCLRRLGLP
ncbi:MAG: fructosamine kinase [Deltaproteobacteria bacterium]|nr:MAG: fructosamine kinase [Deltaproteobacteria bacterium]